MMKTQVRYYYYVFLSLLMLFTLPSCDNEEAVDGTEKEKVTFPSFEEKLLFTEYMRLPIESFPYKNSHFSTGEPAKNYLPSWLFDKYYTPTQGSIAWVDYKFNDYLASPDVDLVSNLKVHHLTKDNLKSVWGNIISDFLSPNKPESLLPQILDETFPAAKEGEHYMISYYYSETEETIKESTITYISEDFNSYAGGAWSFITVDGWYNGNTVGGIPFRTQVSGINKIPMAYDRDNPGSDAWLVHKKAVDLSTATAPVLEFRYGAGYFVLDDPAESIDCMYVKITDKFDGTTPTTSSWTDVSEKTGIRTAPKATGYPGTAVYQMNLKEYIGGKVFVGFNYHLPPRGIKYGKAPLYYVDDIKITDLRKEAQTISKEKKYALYQYVNGAWIEKTDSYYMLQAEDYATIGTETLSRDDAETSMPPLLLAKYPNATIDDVVVVVFVTALGNSQALEFVFKDNNWVIPENASLMMTDKYIFNKEAGWVFESNSVSNN